VSRVAAGCDQRLLETNNSKRHDPAVPQIFMILPEIGRRFPLPCTYNENAPTPFLLLLPKRNVRLTFGQWVTEEKATT
jgi:hypothetical protein